MLFKNQSKKTFSNLFFRFPMSREWQFMEILMRNIKK